MKQFIVALNSSNRNSFGLAGFVLIARDGEAWEVARYFAWNRFDVVDVPLDQNGSPNWAKLSCEIPRQLPEPPAGLIAEAWAKARTK